MATRRQVRSPARASAAVVSRRPRPRPRSCRSTMIRLMVALASPNGLIKAVPTTRSPSSATTPVLTDSDNAQSSRRCGQPAARDRLQCTVQVAGLRTRSIPECQSALFELPTSGFMCSDAIAARTEGGAGFAGALGAFYRMSGPRGTFCFDRSARASRKKGADGPPPFPSRRAAPMCQARFRTGSRPTAAASPPISLISVYS